MFSLMQWSVGLPYFHQRLSGWGLSGEACLDFGCGTGNWTLAASRLFGRVVGVDVHGQRLRAAELIRNALDIGNVSFESEYREATVGSVDCILLYNVLPYIRDRVETLRRLIAGLKPEGRVVVSFNEIGICPYYLFSGIVCMRRSYMRKAFAGPRYFFIERLLHRHSAFESTHGWLRTAAVLSFFDRAGFVPSWTSWETPRAERVSPLFPHRQFCLPFFREIVFQRR